MFRRLAPIIGLRCDWRGRRPWRRPRPISTRASRPSEIFANDCATCHKARAGLATARTACAVELPARALYGEPRPGGGAGRLCAGAGGERRGSRAQSRAQKPEPSRAERDAPHAEEPKPEQTPTARSRQSPTRGAGRAEAKPDCEAGDRTGASSRAGRPAAADRRQREPPVQPTPAEPPAPRRQPAAVARRRPGCGEPAAGRAAERGAKAAAPSRHAAPARTQPPGESAPVPRDNIPD